MQGRKGEESGGEERPARAWYKHIPSSFTTTYRSRGHCELDEYDEVHETV